MFKKILVANRGEIAVRIIRTCRDMDIDTVAVYTPRDFSSLHVRLADEAVLLHSPQRYGAGDEIIEIAQRLGVDAIHPGYGFLAERADFARACARAGILFIGPSPDFLDLLGSRLKMLQQADEAGFDTPAHSAEAYENDLPALTREAERLGYPVVIKSCQGGRGRGSRMVPSSAKMEAALARAETEAVRVYGSARMYVEKAIYPSYHVDVQVFGDHSGNIIHLGERCSSLLRQNQKLVAESPAPCLSPEQRQRVCQLACEIARTLGLSNAGTVEFLVDGKGKMYFSDFKGRIQVEHPITEMISRIDIVAEQIRIASGQPLRWRQEDISFGGFAMQCRINAEDPWNNFMPSPGILTRFRLPGGPSVRVDTYGYAGCRVPERYDSLLAKLTVWGESREECRARMQRALQDFAINGVRTNLPLLQRIIEHPVFVSGEYGTDFLQHPLTFEPSAETDLRDIAIAAAIAFDRRNKAFRPSKPERTTRGWHQAARNLPG